MGVVSINDVMNRMSSLPTRKNRVTNIMLELAIRNKIKEKKEELKDSPSDEKLRRVVFLLENLPFGKFVTYKDDFKSIQIDLNSSHYGMDKVKQKIFECLNASKYRGDTKFPYLCLYGSPGVGKTSLLQSIGKALGAPLEIISLPGVDSFSIKGIDYNYKSADCGVLINAFIRGGCMNPIIIFDELDKVATRTEYSTVSSILLGICDPVQNTSFVDAFLGVGIDISKATIFFTANDPDAIPEALRNRLTMIKVDDYTIEEKMHIGKDYIIPKYLNELHVESKVRVSQDAIDYIVDKSLIDETTMTLTGGIRDLSKQCEILLYKAIYDLEIHKLEEVNITKEWIVDRLGVSEIDKIREKIKAKSLYQAQNFSRIGTVHSLGVCISPLQGEFGVVDDVTCRVISGLGELKFTGKMLDEPRDAATIAYDFVRANAKVFFGLDGDILANRTVLINSHNPGVAKDGTSAGSVYLIAILSEALRLPVLDSVAMTGQLDLDGSITAVGGVDLKVSACIKSKLSKVFLSLENIQDVSQEQKDSIEIIPVENAFELISYIFPDLTWHCEECGSVLKRCDSDKWMHEEDHLDCIYEPIYEGALYPIPNYTIRRK